MASDSETDLRAMFAPFAINGLSLRNRFVMPGMQRGWCEAGIPQPELAAYYRQRAEGGIALIISEACAIDQPSATQGPKYAWLTEAATEAWRACVAGAHAGGARFFLQLWHEGAVRREGGDGPHAAHATISPSGYLKPGVPYGRAATADELVAIRDAYVRGARTAQAIGADGVEVHGCHGYLLDQFLWEGVNLRDDGYGGPDLRDRVRFPAEIVAAIRAAVGPDFPISFRLSQWKEIDYTAKIARNPEELRTIVTALRDAGVDMFHVSTRRFYTPEWAGSDLGLAGWVKSMTDAAVCAVGSVGLTTDITDNFGEVDSAHDIEPGLRELGRRFDRGDFDLVSVGRSSIGDSDWVRKVQAGAYADIRIFQQEHLALQAFDNTPYKAEAFRELREAEAARHVRDTITE